MSSSMPSPPASSPSRSPSLHSSSVVSSSSPPSSSSTSSPASASATAAASLPSWHFPFGPSSRYHLSEEAKRTHTRVKTSYTPRAPVLSTEQRANRRAQNNSVGGSYPSSPPRAYSRSPLSRFSSYNSNNSSTKMPRTHGAPLTPAKTSRRNSSLQDSPFSDYFSDDARSSLNGNGQAPSNETKALLVKMNKLQSQLMRDQSEKGREAIKIVGRKLGEIDFELNALHAQTRLPIELDDSSVFMAGEKEEAKGHVHSRGPSTVSCQSCASLDSSVESSKVFDRDDSLLERYHVERTCYMRQMQEALEKLNSVQAELRQRQSEFAELHERHYTVMEEKEEEIEHLRSENEGLRQDLGFEYSELLFLKLQMKSLECDVDDLRHENSQVTSPKCSKKKNDILSEMDRWRTDSDWQDVEARFKRRRSKYGIPTSSIHAGSILEKSVDIPKDEIDWQLETIREDRGRVTSLTIKRTDSSQSVQQSIHAEEEPEQQTVCCSGSSSATQPVSLGASTGWAVSEVTFLQKDDANTFVRPPYADHCTQTDLPPLRSLDEDDSDTAPFPTHTIEEFDQEDNQEEENVEESDDEEEFEEDEDDGNEHDSATLNSSPTSEPDHDDLYQDVEEDDETVLEQPILLSIPQQKSAWQELWSSLQSLTGIPDDDEEEDDDY